MNISHVIRVFQSTGQGWRRAVARVRAGLVAVVVLSLAGCASSVSVVETWEGNPAAASNAATLEAPGEIRVTRVNGRVMTNFLMDDLALDYALLPGENEVVFVYKTIWAKSTVVRNGESKVHVIESEPQVVRFEAEAGETYRFAGVLRCYRFFCRNDRGKLNRLGWERANGRFPHADSGVFFRRHAG